MNSDCDGGTAFRSMLSTLESLKKTARGKDKNIEVIQKGIREYLEDCTICKRQGENSSDCHRQAMEKLFRHMPFIYQSVYPWRNYEWDYGNFIDNNYSAMATGSDKNADMFFNFGIFFKFLNAYLFDANPNGSSVAGGTNAASDYPVYGCQGNNARQCQATNLVRNRNAPSVPYTDSFFNKSIGGEQSSSYFVKVGYCPRPDIPDELSCQQRGYDWTSMGGDAACFQPRYAYLDNTPGLDVSPIPGISMKMKGYFPSLTNDFLSLSPEKLLLAMNGRDIKGHMSVQDCPKVETFRDGNINGNTPSKSLRRQNEDWAFIYAIVISFLVVAILTSIYIIRNYF